MKNSYLIKPEQMANYMKNSAMLNQEGIFLYGVTDASVQKLLPPPLMLADPEKPTFYVYVVNIREPTFAPWYMEGGIGVNAKLGDREGLYLFNLQLTGPGALMGMVTGREGAGLPKKLADEIVVERIDDYAHCYIERGGVRLIDVQLDIGQYNNPDFLCGSEGCEDVEGGKVVEGGCLLHKYSMGGKGIEDMRIVYYESPSRFYSWEPATAEVVLASSVDDPWAEIPVVSIDGAAWSINDNYVTSVVGIHDYSPEDAGRAMLNLYAGRYDRSLCCSEHQWYGA